MRSTILGVAVGCACLGIAIGITVAQPTVRVQQLFNECVNEAGFTFRQCVWLQGVMSRYGIR